MCNWGIKRILNKKMVMIHLSQSDVSLIRASSHDGFAFIIYESFWRHHHSYLHYQTSLITVSQK